MTVAVLAGGHSQEREVSLKSGHRVRQALADAGRAAVVVDPAEQPLGERLSSGDVDAAYIALHGKEGEDGTVQRLLELIGVPYTGTRPFACELAFDKILAKEALDAAGVPTPRWAAVEASAVRDLGAGAVMDRVLERVGLPAVVKPSRGGSSMGITFVERAADFTGAVMSGLSFSDAVVVEARVTGTEVAAGFVGSPPEALPLVEIVPKSGVYDYAARYTPGATEYFAPARLDEGTAAATAGARRAFEALGLEQVGRTDLIVDDEGVAWILEVNVSPGMTETSLLPMAAQAAGYTLPDFCTRVLELALARA